jgi:hexosaminidase
MSFRNVMLMVCAIGTQTGFATAGEAQALHPTIIPRPAEMVVSSGTFEITASTPIYVQGQDAETRAVAEYFAEWLRAKTGFPVPIETVAEEDAPARIIVFAVIGGSDTRNLESYTLSATSEKLVLAAPHPRGLFRGVQTIRQLLSPELEAGTKSGSPRRASWEIPCVRISDQPRYPWRGMLLDCGRHFMSKEFVKRYIDLLAYHKLNVLHWHLTEDQGWRIEIKKYPKLAEISAWRKATRESEQPRDAQGRYGGYYTQEDVREIVEYARSRQITVVPEIELPGHSVAALAAYPELSCTGGPFEVLTEWGVKPDVYCAGNEQTFEFLENVLAEVVELFPSELIHIGGDECPKARWEKCAKCQKRIKDEGLKDEHELQSYFIRRIEKFLNGKGRRLIGWDEILEGGLAPNATVQSWRGMNGAIAAATSGHDVIASPTSNCYLDYAQVRLPGEPTWMGFLPLERVYSFEPTPEQLTKEQAKHVLGVEGNMWTEHAPQSRVDWQVFPRLCALAEVGWSPKDARDFDDFSRRLATHYRRLDALGVEYFVPPPELVSRETAFTESVDVVLAQPFEAAAIHYTLDGSEPTQSSPKYTEKVRLTASTVLKARLFLDNGRTSGIAEYRFRRIAPLEPVELEAAVPGLGYAYYEGRWSELPDFDQLTPAAIGTTDSFTLDVRKRPTNYGLRFSGYLNVSTEGTYAFYTSSDDGSRLWIDDELVVDNNGLHGPREAQGQVILRSGTYPITVEFFQARGAQGLEVSYEGPGIEKQPIPASTLVRQPGD